MRKEELRYELRWELRCVVDMGPRQGLREVLVDARDAVDLGRFVSLLLLLLLLMASLPFRLDATDEPFVPVAPCMR